MRQRLAILSQRSTLVFRYHDALDAAADADACVVPVRELEVLALSRDRDLASAQAPALGPLLLAYGPPECLRAAFLAGCDDYLREPWDPEELEARLARLVGRRESRRVAMGGRCVLEGRTVRFSDGTEVRLSAHEAVVAGLLFANRGAVVTRRALAFALWGRALEGPSRAIDVHVSALRRKLGRGSISCVRGQGYLVD
jgi:hypothetical protein